MLTDGDFIHLNHDGSPDAFYVRGHVTDVAALSALHAEFSELYVTGPWAHKWARWSMETVDDEPALVIRTCDGPGRGRFKVTVCDVLEASTC